MNSYERVIATLEHRQPDRVPYVESVIDLKLMQSLLPGCDYYQFNDWLGMDSVGQNRSSWSRDNVEYVDKEKGLFRDKWGVIRAFGPESTPAPVEGPIKRPEDLKTYTPPDPEAPDVLGNIPEVVARYKGKKAITALGRDAFFNPAFLRGMEQFLIDLTLEPALTDAIIEQIVDHYAVPAQEALAAAAVVAALDEDGTVAIWATIHALIVTHYRPIRHSPGHACLDRKPAVVYTARQEATACNARSSWTACSGLSRRSPTLICLSICPRGPSGWMSATRTVARSALIR